MKFDRLSNLVIGCAIEVHKNLGPGLLESTYEQCLAYELKESEISFRLQHPLPVEYKGVKKDGFIIFFVFFVLFVVQNIIKHK